MQKSGLLTTQLMCFTLRHKNACCRHSLKVHKQDTSHEYHNDPKFLDRYVKANSADPDQTAPRGAV